MFQGWSLAYCWDWGQLAWTNTPGTWWGWSKQLVEPACPGLLVVGVWAVISDHSNLGKATASCWLNFTLAK
jgi:hypothetical protein